MALVFSAALLIVIACLVARRLHLRDMATLRSEGNPLLRVELRRRTEMRTHADGLGGLSYPEPAETRIVSWHLFTLPVWSRTECIGLPAGCEGRIDMVRPEEFDQHFTPSFKLASQRAAAARRSRAAVA